MFRSIQWRIAFFYTALIVGSMSLVTVYLLNLVWQNHLTTFRTQMAGEARLIATSSLPLLERGASSQDIDALADRLAGRIGAHVTVMGPYGDILGDSEGTSAQSVNQSGRPEVSVALNGGLGVDTRAGPDGAQVMLVAAPIQQNDRVLGAARVALPLTQVEESLREIIATIVLAAIILVLLTVLLAVYIARRIAGPIGVVTQSVRRMAQGDLDQKIYVPSSGEVGELAKSVNEVAASFKRTIDAINLERSKMEVVLQDMADGLLMTDRRGVVILANPAAARIFGGDARSYVGKTFIEVARDYELNRPLLQCLEKGEQQTRDVDVGGLEKRHVRIIVTPIRHAGSTYALALFQDVTELRRLENVRREFVANVSHELRTPIASVKALVESLQEGGLEDQAVARDFLARAAGEVDKLTSMVDELLDLSRLESGQHGLQMEPTDLGEAVREAARRLEPQAARKGLTLTVNIAPGPLTVMVDKRRMTEVVANLVDNAVKFTPEGGRIQVSVRPGDDRVEVTVADTGMGIASQDLPFIFQRFYKVDRSRAGGGVGLGLAITRHIVQTLGGTVRVESALGKGSIFTVTLPLAKTG